MFTVLLLCLVALSQAQNSLKITNRYALSAGSCGSTIISYVSYAQECPGGVCSKISSCSTAACTTSTGWTSNVTCQTISSPTTTVRNPLGYPGAEFFTASDCNTDSFVLGGYSKDGAYVYIDPAINPSDPEKGKYKATFCENGKISSRTCDQANEQNCAERSLQTQAYGCQQMSTSPQTGYPSNLYFRLTCDASHGTLSFAVIALAICLYFVF